MSAALGSSARGVRARKPLPDLPSIDLYISSPFEPIGQRWLQQPQCPASGAEPPSQPPSVSSIPSEPDHHSPSPPTAAPPASAKATSESETSPRKSESSAPNSSSTISKMPNSSPYATRCGTSSSLDFLGPYDINPVFIQLHPRIRSRPPPHLLQI